MANTDEKGPTGQPIRRVRTLVVLDEAGGGGMTPDDEFEQLCGYWRDVHDIELVARRSDTFSPHGAEADGVELIIFDWGGASIGNDLLQHQVRWLINWAQDHPSALIVVRSMAGAFLEAVVGREHFPKLHNVLIDDGDLELPSWWSKHLRAGPERAQPKEREQ